MKKTLIRAAWLVGAAALVLIVLQIDDALRVRRARKAIESAFADVGQALFPLGDDNTDTAGAGSADMDRSRCLKNLSLLREAHVDYVGNGDKRVHPRHLSDLWDDLFITDPTRFICPAGTLKYTEGRFTCSYDSIFDMAAEALCGRIPSDVMMIWDRDGVHPDGSRYVGFGRGGGIREVGAVEFERLYAKTHAWLKSNSVIVDGVRPPTVFPKTPVAQ